MYGTPDYVAGNAWLAILVVEPHVAISVYCSIAKLCAVRLKISRGKLRYSFDSIS